MKLASAARAAGPPVTSAIPPPADVPETSSAMVAKAEPTGRSRPDRGRQAEMPPQPASHGTGNGILGVLPASSLPRVHLAGAGLRRSAARRRSRRPIQQNGAIKPVATHTGWIIQVGALESESEAQQRIEAARNQAHGLLSKADPFTEPVVAKGDKKLFRARFAGLDRDQAEAVCRTLKRSDISCITIRN